MNPQLKQAADALANAVREYFTGEISDVSVLRKLKAYEEAAKHLSVNSDSELLDWLDSSNASILRECPSYNPVCGTPKELQWETASTVREAIEKAKAKAAILKARWQL